MTKINAVVRKDRKLKNNTYKVYLAIHHRDNTSYVDSGMFCGVSNTTCKVNFANGAFLRNEQDFCKKNFELQKMLNLWYNSLDKVCNKNLMDVHEVVSSAQEIIKRTTGANTLVTLSDDYINIKKSEGKDCHAEYCRYSVSKLVEFLGGDVRLSDISLQTIQLFEVYLKKCTKDIKGNKVRAYSDAYIGSTLARIKAIINYAVNFGYVTYDVHPFAATKIRASRVRDCAIGVDDIVKYRDADIKSECQQKARDAWMLSFYLCGVNFADMAEGVFDGNEFVYVRSKTRGRCDDDVRIPIFPQARVIIDKYINEDGQLDWGYKFTKANDLLHFFARKYRTAKDDIGMPQCFSFMSARKSFAQIASELGVSDNLIDYMLGHSLNKSGVLRYYRKITPRQVHAAMERVFDYIDNPSKYDEFMAWNAMLR